MHLNELEAPSRELRQIAQDINDNPRVLSWSKTADKFAKENGFRNLGSGHFGAVYGSPKHNFVLKIFAARDTNYISWVQWCLKHQANPYVPKFKGGLVKVNQTLRGIRLEKLTSPTSNNLSMAIKDAIKVQRFNGESLKSIAFKYNVPISALLNDDLAEIRTFLFPYYKRGFLDLHPGNFMARGSQLVIIDPIADPYDFRKI